MNFPAHEKKGDSSPFFMPAAPFFVLFSRKQAAAFSLLFR